MVVGSLTFNSSLNRFPRHWDSAFVFRFVKTEYSGGFLIRFMTLSVACGREALRQLCKINAVASVIKARRLQWGGQVARADR